MSANLQQQTVHTPGPWKQFAPRVGDEIDVNYRTVRGGDGLFKSGRGFELTGFINEGDASLLASAPELLDACLDAISKIEDCDDGKINFRRDFADRLKDAVAKVV